MTHLSSSVVLLCPSFLFSQLFGMDPVMSSDIFEDHPPSRRLKRRRRSNAIIMGQGEQVSHVPKDLTFIADNVNGKGKKVS